MVEYAVGSDAFSSGAQMTLPFETGRTYSVRSVNQLSGGMRLELVGIE